MQKVLASRTWTDPQKRWLKRIGEQVEKEIVVDREALDREPFAADGGFTRLNKVFDGELEAVLAGINEEMWKKSGLMTSTTDIVAKLWKLCHVLRDDGVTYNEYVTELTYLLFLKMLEETRQRGPAARRLPLGRTGQARGARPARLLQAAAARSRQAGRPRTRWSGRSSPMPRPGCASRPTSRRSPPASTSSTGSRPARRASAISTRGCWRRTPPRRSPAPASTSRRAR